MFVERARDAADPQQYILSHFSRHLTARNHIGYRESATGLQDTKRLLQHPVLVGREIDHTVRNHYIHRVVGQGNVFDFALQELDIVDPRLALVFAGQREHLVRHVEPIGLSAGTDSARGEQDVDAAAGPEVEYPLAWLEFRERRRVAATQGGEDGFLRDFARLIGAVQIRSDGVAATVDCRSRSATGTTSGSDAPCRIAIFLLNRILQVHWSFSFLLPKSTT